MKQERIKLEDIIPDGSNPREDFGDIEALASSFSLTPERAGEPINPPIVVRDGSLYRIVDGERRYRAMKQLGTESCLALVCEDMDDANAMLAMVATDDKKLLTDEEKSRGVQQALLLGVSPAKVSKVAGVDAGAIKRSMGRVQEKKLQTMSLGQLMAIDEFSDVYDDMEQVRDAKNWEHVAQIIRDRRHNDALANDMREVLKGNYIKEVDSVPDNFRFRQSCDNAFELRDFIDELGDDDAVAVIRSSAYYVSCSIYSEATVIEETETDEEREQREQREAKERKAEEILAWLQMLNRSILDWWVKRDNEGVVHTGAIEMTANMIFTQDFEKRCQKFMNEEITVSSECRGKVGLCILGTALNLMLHDIYQVRKLVAGGVVYEHELSAYEATKSLILAAHLDEIIERDSKTEEVLEMLQEAIDGRDS